MRQKRYLVPGYEFHLGRMSALDRQRKLIKVAPILDDDTGEVLIREREIEYDSLVLAVGGITNDFGTPGVQKNCLFLNTPQDAEHLRKQILLHAFQVVTGNSPCSKLRIGIVGAGATVKKLQVTDYFKKI